MSYDNEGRKYNKNTYLRKYNNVNTYLPNSLNIEDIKSVGQLNEIIKNSSKKLKTYRLNQALIELAEQAIQKDPRFNNMTELVETLICNFVIEKVKENMKNVETRIIEIKTINYEDEDNHACEDNKSNSLPLMLENLYKDLKTGKKVIYNPEKNISILIKMTKKYVGKDKRAEELLQLLENAYPKGEKQ